MKACNGWSFLEQHLDHGIMFGEGKVDFFEAQRRFCTVFFKEW